MNRKKEKIDIKSISKKRIAVTVFVAVVFIVVTFVCSHMIVEGADLHTKVFGDDVTRMYIFALKLQFSLAVVIPVISGYLVSTFKLPILVKLFLITYASMIIIINVLFIIMFILPL